MPSLGYAPPYPRRDAQLHALKPETLGQFGYLLHLPSHEGGATPFRWYIIAIGVAALGNGPVTV